MIILIFDFIAELTSSYHNGGGLVVIARCIESAKKLIKTDGYIRITDNEWSHVIIYPLQETIDTEEKLFIFPNAGCC